MRVSSREQPKFDELVYEERLVAFVDILGWRHAVETRPAGDLGWLIGLFQHIEQGAAAGAEFARQLPLEVVSVPHGIEASQFSDSIVISVPAHTPSARWTIEGYLHWLCMLAAQNGFLLRGGVAQGRLFHRQRMLYGPALVRAYDIESKIAVFPRIVLDKPLEGEFYPGPQLSDEKGVYGHRKSWRRDEDGCVFFDYMQPFGAMEIYPDSGHDPWTPNVETLGQYRSVIGNGIVANQGNRQVMEKYRWAASYLVAIGQEYPALVQRLGPFVVHERGELVGWDFLPPIWLECETG